MFPIFVLCFGISDLHLTLQSPMEHSREKSWFLRQQKEVWDRLTAQLATAQQKVMKLAPATEDVTNLRIQEADARWHADEAEQVALEGLERALKDEEEAIAVKKERDELF